jgi:uncharacterized membrane protein YqjE
MYNSIIISSYFFGSVYLFSKSLELINNSLLEDKKNPYKLIILNGLTFVFSGCMIIYSFNLIRIL